MRILISQVFQYKSISARSKVLKSVLALKICVNRIYLLIPKSSTSNIRVAPGPIMPPAP